MGFIVNATNELGTRPVTRTVHVSTSYPFVCDVIFIESAGYKVGGERKLLIWKVILLLVDTRLENNEEPTTVKAT